MTQQGPLARWVAAVGEELELDVDADHVTRLVLDLARDVAHTVDRPAAPVTAYLLGLAAGATAAGAAAGAEGAAGGTDPRAATEQAAARIRQLLEGWSAEA